jgi:hypothetical protein
MLTRGYSSYIPSTLASYCEVALYHVFLFAGGKKVYFLIREKNEKSSLQQKVANIG